MSAQTAPSPGKADPHWTRHSRERWHDERRNDVADRDRERGWWESIPVEYPSAESGYRARYHPDGDCVLLWTRDIVEGDHRPVVVTVINLRDRQPEEQAYVRYQAHYGRGSR